MAESETQQLEALETSFCTPTDLGGEAAYRSVCKVAGLEPIPGGWGLLHCKNAEGEHWTAGTSDVELVRVLAAARPPVLASLTMPADVFPLRRRGWPDEWV